MRESLRTAGLLAILLILTVGCTDNCCTKQKCIDEYGLGDPDDCFEWCLEHDCGVYPSPGPPIKIRKPGGAGSEIVYEVDNTVQAGVNYTPETQRQDLVGIQIYEFKCIVGTTVYDAQHIEVIGSNGTLGIKRTTPLNTVRWTISTGGATVTLEPVPPPTPVVPDTIPDHVIQGFTGAIEDVGTGRTCDEVLLRVYEPM